MCGLALVVALVVYSVTSAAAAQETAPPIRLLVAVDASLTDMRDGVRLGIEEMQRTASLLGRTLEVAWATEPPLEALSAARAGVSAALVATAGELPATAFRPVGLPVLALSPLTAARPTRWLFQLRAERPGTEWRDDLSRFGAGELNDRYRRRTGRGMTADAWVGWVAVKAVVEAALRADTADPAALLDALRGLAFDAHKGVPLYFDEHGRLVQPTY